MKRSFVEFRSPMDKNGFNPENTDSIIFPQNEKLRNEICESVYKKKTNIPSQKSSIQKNLNFQIEPVLKNRELNKLDNTLDS